MKNRSFQVYSHWCLKTIIVCIWSFSPELLAFSHTSQNIREVSISVNVSNATVEQVFKTIEQKSPFVFAYRQNLISNISTRISLQVRKETIVNILNRISESTDLLFKQTSDNTIAVRRFKNRSKDLTKEKSDNKTTIVGQITDENGEPLAGTNIYEKGTSNGVFTDYDGNYSLTLENANAVLVISFTSYKTQEITVGTQTTINVQMVPDAALLDEVVVIGYGKLSRSKVLGAVTSVRSNDISQLPVPGVDEAIAGRAAGVQVVSSGAPGNASQIKIRGVGTISAGRSPLIVVDGYPLTEGSDLNAVNPLDIESIQVLKDAASTAIYGSRGANGVIFVTTKSAKSDKATFSFDSYSGFQRVLNPMKFLNAYEYAQMVKEARDWGYVSDDPVNRSENDDTATRLANGARPRNIIPSNIDKYLLKTSGLTDNNWLDDIFQNGRIQSHNLSVSGKSGKTIWFVSGGYFNQEGLILGSGFERFTAKLNLETEFNDKVRFGINFTPSVSGQESIVEGWTDGPMQQAILMEPFFTPYNDEGVLNISQQIRWHNNGGTDGALVENPVAIALQKKDERNKFRLFGSTFLEVNIFEGLTFKTLLGGDYDYSLREQFRPSTIGRYRIDVLAAVPSASERTRVRKNWISENTLTYNRAFNGHSINLLGGYSYQKERADETRVSAPVLDSDDIPNIAGTASTTSIKNISEWILISYFGRLQYDYDSKYLFSASLRRDGSSRFGSNNKFGVFPSFSGGWVVDREGFFPEQTFVSALKLRYSWGKTGNNQIGNYGATAVLRQLNGILDDQFANGQRPSTAPNKDLSWETSSTNNFGIDLGLFNNKLSFSAEYFIAKTKDMLLEAPVPLQSGFSTSLQNAGSMQNKGFEFVLSTSEINLGKVKWSSSFNFSQVKNKVTGLASRQTQIIVGANITRVGHSIGDFYGYVVDGIYKSQEEIDSSPQSGTTVKVGDWRIRDVDGFDEDGKLTGEPDGIINDADRTVIGSPLPDFTYGFNNRFAYKSFDINVFIDGVQGIDVLSATVRNATNGQGFSNQLAWYFKNRWHPENNPSGTLARPDYTQSSERNRANVSSAFLQNGSFLRVRNITLGYTLPETLTSKIKAQRMRLYFTAKNPFLLTSFRGYNPEQSRSNPLNPSNTQGSYPQNKSFVLGLNVSF